AEERPAVVARCTVRMQVVRRAEDRIAWIANVAAEPVSAPRRRHELHGTLGARGAVVAELVERALDEVDCGENIPRHPESTLCVAVVTEQGRRRQRRSGSETFRVRDRRQAPELTLCGQIHPHPPGDPGRNESERRARQTGATGEQELDPLVVERVEGDLARGSRLAAGAPRVDRASEL